MEFTIFIPDEVFPQLLGTLLGILYLVVFLVVFRVFCYFNGITKSNIAAHDDIGSLIVAAFIWPISVPIALILKLFITLVLLSVPRDKK